MTTVQDVLDFIQTLAPREMAMDWDNVGLLAGSRKQPVRRILVALDPFEQVSEEAAAIGADLIVTHHPLIFRPLRSVSDDTSVGRTVMQLIRHGISAINAHTNLDCADGGVNDVLAQKLGLRDITVIGQDHLLRCGDVEEQTLDAFLAGCKAALGTPVLRYAQGCATVRRVAVGGGACADEMMDAVAAGCDTFVTSDVKYNQFWDAHDLGLNIIDAGHFYTENPVTGVLCRKLQEQFPELSVSVSAQHADIMKFFG